MQQPTGLAGLGIGNGSSRDLLRRTSSRSSIQRSESAPLLTPLWEPQQEPDYDHLQPTWTNTSLSLDHDREWLESQCPFDRERESYHNLNDLCALPTSWQRVLSTMAAESTRHAPVSQSEMLGAAQESLHDALPLSFEYGLVDHSYILKKELVAESNFKVMEGVELRTQRNFCLKIVPRRRFMRLRATKPLDPMQVMYLVVSFVHEVFCHPNYVCIVLKWGMHEVDASHQLSVWIFEATQLLDELLQTRPSFLAKKPLYLRLASKELQRLLLRTASLDLYLNSNLWLPED